MAAGTAFQLESCIVDLALVDDSPIAPGVPFDDALRACFRQWPGLLPEQLEFAEQQINERDWVLMFAS
jgi:hypothetical protein